MKKGVLILLDINPPQGAENVAVNIAVKLKESSKYTPIVCSTRKGGMLEERLKSHNIKYFLLNRSNRYEFYKFFRLKKIIKDENIKIIHAHKIGSNFWGSIMGELVGIPVISHYHGYNEKVKHKINLFANKLIGVLSTKIISVSESVTRRLITNEAFPQSKITTIHNGINYKRYQLHPNFDIRTQFNIGMDTPIVGIVAALTQVKNHELFLLAAREILDHMSEVRFLIVGQGDRKSKLEQMASELGIANNCIFTGFRTDIPEIISIMDIGVLTSLSEGIPLALLEYMASSKPVVSTDVGGISEVVVNGENGFLAPPGNFHKLAEKIIRLVENKSLAAEIGKNAFNTVKEKFSEDGMMDKIESLYDEILSNNR